MKKKIHDIGMVHGVFDLIHIGHIEHFLEAKKYCKKLIVSVTSDKYVNKGPNRPAFSLKERIKLLKSISCINEVVVSDSETPVKNIKKYKPRIYFKGYDYQQILNKPENNLKKELDELKKLGGIFHITKSKLKSSSKLLNENYNFISKELKFFFKSIDKTKLIKKLKENLFEYQKNFKKNNILLFGDQIIDTYTKVSLLGKSQKSSVISSAKLSTKKYGGGSILVANFLAEFFDGLNYYINGNSKTLKILKKYISNSDKIKFINSGNNVGQILTKERFIENYSSARLFQVNSNQKIFNNLQEKKKFEHEFLKKIVSYKNIIIFDYGHGYIDTKFAAKFNKLKKNFFINCQTNSYNFGFNLFTKYNKSEILCIDETEFRLTIQDKENPIKFLLLKNIKLLDKHKIFIVTSGANGCYVLSNKSFLYQLFLKLH